MRAARAAAQHRPVARRRPAPDRHRAAGPTCRTRTRSPSTAACARRPASARTRASSTPSWPRPTSCAAPPRRRGGATRPSARRPSARSEVGLRSRPAPSEARELAACSAPFPALGGDPGANNRQAGSCRRIRRRRACPCPFSPVGSPRAAGACPRASWCRRSADAVAARRSPRRGSNSPRRCSTFAPTAPRRRSTGSPCPVAARALAPARRGVQPDRLPSRPGRGRTPPGHARPSLSAPHPRRRVLGRCAPWTAPPSPARSDQVAVVPAGSVAPR